jgi:hypothetical protein
MKYDVEVFSKLYPVLIAFLYHFTAFRETHALIEELEEDVEFWVKTCDAHINVAVISWCMIFGAYENNAMHWKNFRNEEFIEVSDDFNKALPKLIGKSEREIDNYVKSMIGFRNKYIAHRDMEYNKQIPYLDMAHEIVIKFDIWARELIKPDYIADDFLSVKVKEYQKEIKNALNNVRNGMAIID